VYPGEPPETETVAEPGVPEQVPEVVLMLRFIAGETTTAVVPDKVPQAFDAFKV
jgi:hypothetical protein